MRAYSNLDTVSIITTVYKCVATVSFTAVGHPSIQADYQIMSVSIMSLLGDICHSYLRPVWPELDPIESNDDRFDIFVNYLLF